MSPLAPALLILALSLPAAAADEDPKPAETEAGAGGDLKLPDLPPLGGAPNASPMGTMGRNGPLSPEVQKTVEERKGKVQDASGQFVDASKFENLPAYARKAMDSGLTPIVDGQGNVLGFDDPVGGMCWLPNAVQDRFGGSDPAPGTTPGDQQEIAAIGGTQQGKEQQPGQTPAQPAGNNLLQPTAGDFVNQPPPGNTEIAQTDVEGDVGDLSKKLDTMNKGRDEQEAGAAGNGSDSGPFGASSVPGSDTAFTGPGPSRPSTAGGGTTMGPNGQVAQSGPAGPGAGPGAGREIRCRGSECDAVAAGLKAFHQGAASGPLDGPRDPNARSVYQTASNLSFLDPLKRLASRLWEGDAAASGELRSGAPLDDQAAAAGNREFDGSGEYRPAHETPKLCEKGNRRDFCWNDAAPN